MADRKLRPETLAVHAGQMHLGEVRPVAQPIMLSSTYARDETGNLPEGFLYSRLGNPNRAALEDCLATLEGGEACAAFASGSAATMAVFQSLSSGDHAILAQNMYYGSLLLVKELASRSCVELSSVDATDLNALKAAVRANTRLIWIETPSNPLMRITDIAGASAIARSCGALLAVDNTFATPLLQQPIMHGADLVMHATSKYIAGHSDVIGGAIITRAAELPMFQTIRKLQALGGAIPSPFDCWLALRGVRTLPVRMAAQSTSAERIAEYLAAHNHVHTVHYPSLKSHPGHEIAARQMTRGGAMLSFQVSGGRERALAVAMRTKLFTSATSLGGVESLIEHRASVEKGTTTPHDLLRVSVGLEHADDLIADLEQALAPG